MFKSIKDVKRDKAIARTQRDMLIDAGASARAIDSASRSFLATCDIVASHIHRWN